MGLYIYLNQDDLLNMRNIKDLQVKEVFEEAVKHDKSLMMSETVYTIKRWFKKDIEHSRFSVYHEQFMPNGKSAFQARQQLSATGSRELVIAYLYGIINGALANKTTL